MIPAYSACQLHHHTIRPTTPHSFNCPSSHSSSSRKSFPNVSPFLYIERVSQEEGQEREIPTAALSMSQINAHTTDGVKQPSLSSLAVVDQSICRQLLQCNNLIKRPQGHHLLCPIATKCLRASIVFFFPTETTTRRDSLPLLGLSSSHPSTTFFKRMR